MKIYGVVLAGGLSRRMEGRDKALIQVRGAPLIAHAAKRLAPQVLSVAVSSNRDDNALAFLGLPVLADVIPGHLGPLAGILTAMEWAQTQGGDDAWLASVAVDTPWFPSDLVTRLHSAAGPGRAAIASSGGRVHPVFGLWSVRLAAELRAALVQRNERRVMVWASSLPSAVADWPLAGRDPFTNVNTPNELSVVQGMDLS